MQTPSGERGGSAALRFRRFPLAPLAQYFLLERGCSQTFCQLFQVLGDQILSGGEPRSEARIASSNSSTVFTNRSPQCALAILSTIGPFAENRLPRIPGATVADALDVESTGHYIS